MHVVFKDALATLIRNKDLVTELKLVDLVLPSLDSSYQDALDRFERGELTKVVYKPNGLNVEL